LYRTVSQVDEVDDLSLKASLPMFQMRRSAWHTFWLVLSGGKGKADKEEPDRDLVPTRRSHL
jgi:hypothetical protein